MPKGHWLNASGKLYPKLYPKGFSVSPFNALVLALDSDAKGCKEQSVYAVLRSEGTG